jgi:hypothetical protein
MLYSRPRTLTALHTNLSYNRSSLYRFRTDHTESTSHVIAKHSWDLTSLCIRKLREHKENTVTVLLYDVTVYVEVCLPSRCLEMGCVTPLCYCCVHVLLSNGCSVAQPFLHGANTPQYVSYDCHNRRLFPLNSTLAVDDVKV